MPPQGGVRPDGYRLDPTTKRLVVDEERAGVVREIFDLYTHKRLGTRAIANLLNERGLRTRTDGPWSAHTIRWLLTNPAYRGTPAQRKALIEQLVHEIQIVGPSRIRPIYRIPRRNQDTEPGADDGTTVRTMGNLVGDTGIEPVTSSV